MSYQARFQYPISELQSNLTLNLENLLLSETITKKVAYCNNNREIRISFDESNKPAFLAGSSAAMFAFTVTETMLEGGDQDQRWFCDDYKARSNGWPTCTLMVTMTIAIAARRGCNNEQR
ncbi:hypothetical protein S245_034010 [Arachis hypogaea]